MSQSYDEIVASLKTLRGTVKTTKETIEREMKDGQKVSSIADEVVENYSNQVEQFTSLAEKKLTELFNQCPDIDALQRDIAELQDKTHVFTRKKLPLQDKHSDDSGYWADDEREELSDSSLLDEWDGSTPSNSHLS